MHDYFYGTQSEQFTFYRVPTVLFTEEQYKEMSAEAKVLYGILLKRMELSAKSGWLDEKGRVYIIFKQEEIMEKLSCAKQKAVKLLEELEGKYGLIERRRQGLGRPNLIYVKNFIDSGKGVSESNFKKYENQTSGSLKIELQEVRKSYPSNRDISYTERSQRDPIYPGSDGRDRHRIVESYFRDAIEYETLLLDYPDKKETIDGMFENVSGIKSANDGKAFQIKKFSLAAGKTAKSILISCGARLAPFDIEEVREITKYDELALDTIGDRKTALFLIMSDTDGTFNFLLSMIYSQLFNLLCEKADDVYGGRLPVHVRCLIDEAANIGQIPNFEKLIATMRSREISACMVLQARSQLKAIYKDNADTIIGNCDSQLFLGGTEPTTLKELSEALGKETIDSFNTGESRGREQSHSLNYQKLGHELLSRDELQVMDGSKCILQLRGVRPSFSDKYDLLKHPNYRFTSDADPGNTFDIVKFLDHRAKLRSNDEYEVVDAG